MRKATLVFESTNKPGVVTFSRGRVQEKGRRWGTDMTVGRTKFETGKEYQLQAVLELVNGGIRVNIDPIQPTRKVVLEAPAWKEMKIEAPGTEATEEDEDE